MTTRPFKTDLMSLVRIFIRNFEVLNFGVQAQYIYLPTDLYDHVVDRIEDEFRAAGVPDAVLDKALNHSYMGVKVLPCRTNDIIVTEDLLP